MRITPLDVRKQEFRKAVRGFDCDEVRAFLATLADEYETVLVDNKQIRDTLMEQEDKISEYKNMERTLRDTLMTAEKLMQETKETATREGEIIIMGAHQKAKGVLEECRIRTEELRREIVGLRKEKETYLARFKGLAEAQISFVEAHKNDFADLDKRLVDMVDTVVDGAISSESQATRQVMPQAAIHTAAPAPIEVAPSYQVPSEAPAAPVREEVDMWRDYNPGKNAPQEIAAPQAPAAPVASPEGPISEPEALVNEVISETAAAPEAPSEGISAATVDMAAMGIPVPAVPIQTAEKADNESQAITKAITATLTENAQPETISYS